MEVWETIRGLGEEFDRFFESISKKDRSFLAKCSEREYDGYMKKNFGGTL